MFDRRYYEKINEKRSLELHHFDNSDSRRWSVDRKLQSRYYCQIRSWDDFFDIFNFKCLFATSMLVIFIALSVLATEFYFASFDMLPTADHFEYIIVGAGPAGSLLARRLSDSGRTVLLLEAGGSTQYQLGGSDYFGGPITRFDIPLMWSSISSYDDYHWQGFNIPNVLQAKGLGGCGIHNAMLYVRCLESDILNWNLTQEGWTWNEVLKTYKSLENYIPDKNEGIPDYHGTGSAHTLTTSRFLEINMDPIGSEFVSSAIQHGHRYVNDFNNPEKNSRIGVGYYHFNIDNGRRDSVARRMLSASFAQSSSSSSSSDSTSSSSSSSSSSTGSKGEKSRKPSAFPILTPSKHLTISTYSTVEKVLLHSIGSGTGVRAIGVEYSQDGIKKRAFLKSKTHRLSATHSLTENIPNSLSVILTAGALLTPHLLMSSGIGPEEELKKANIPLKVSSPLVGSNLQDHPAIGMTFNAHPALAAKYPSAYSLLAHWSKYVKAIQLAESTVDDLTTSKISPSEYGILGTPGFSSGGFLVSPFARSKHEPDIQLTIFPVVAEPHMYKKYGDISNHSNTDPLPSSTIDVEERKDSDHEILVTVALLTPEARYVVTLNHSSPHSTPLISLPKGVKSYLSDHDKQVLAWGVQQVREIFLTPPLRDLTLGEVTPGSTVTGKNLLHWIEKSSLTNSHWVGTSSIGPSSPPLHPFENDDENEREDDNPPIEIDSPTSPHLSPSPSPSPSPPSLPSSSQRKLKKKPHQSTTGIPTTQSVLDSQFRVRGVSNLRVADSSAIPLIPNGNVHSTVVMIASRAADMLIEEYKLENEANSWS